MSVGHTGYGGRRYELRAGTIYVLPLEVEKAPGVTSITVGFPLAEMSEYVDAKTAAGIVDYLNQPSPRAIEAAEADLLGRALEALRMAAPLLAEAREALCGRDDVCTTSDGDDALLPLRDAINFILSQAREVK